MQNRKEEALATNTKVLKKPPDHPEIGKFLTNF